MDWLKIRNSFLVVIVSLSLFGCATSAENIEASYVSPIQYKELNCRQISAEAQRISDRVAELSGVQDKKATDDAVAAGVAVVLFWPAVFLISGDGATAAELGRLKGQFEALDEAAQKKRCKFRLETKAKKQKIS